VDDTLGSDKRDLLVAGPTPIPISPRGRMVLLLVALVALILLFRWSPSLLPLLLGGATLALILSSPVRLLARIVPRGVAIAMVVVGLLLLVFLALVTLVPLLIRQLTELVDASPRLVSEAEGTLPQLLWPLAERGLLPAEPSEVIATLRLDLLNRAQALAQSLLGGVLGALSGTVGTLILLAGVLFVAVYLLADIRRFEAAYLRAVPVRYRRDAQALWNELGHSLSRYLSGLLVLLTIQGVLAYLLNLVLGVPYAFLLGLWMAVTAILPYIGAWLGALPAVVLALFVSPWTAVLSAVGYLVINQIEGNILTPRIQGEAIKVHPLLVFLAVVAGGEIAGPLGAAFAVPVVAVLRVLFDFFAARLYVRPPAQLSAVVLTEATPSPVAASPAGDATA
jgi:predicted PurR-regulated permease PerM